MMCSDSFEIHKGFCSDLDLGQHPEQSSSMGMDQDLDINCLGWLADWSVHRSVFSKTLQKHIVQIEKQKSVLQKQSHVLL